MNEDDIRRQISKVSSFMEFEKTCKKDMFGGVEMYDVKGYYKLLSLLGLFKYWEEQNKV